MQNYKDLKVWEKAHYFTIQVYTISDAFPKTETYGLTNQLRRASSSIAANIAEGCGKNTKADFANFLNISLGSANEAEYFVLLAKDLNYLTLSNYDELTKLVNEIKAMLINLISKVRG
ncbi:MAG: four helix bundle protein [Ferruginibacter sp.]